MKRRKCIAIATVVSQKCPLNGKRKKHARVTLEVVKKNDNLTTCHRTCLTFLRYAPLVTLFVIGECSYAGDWSEWSGCTCSCDGGQYVSERSKAIRSQAPKFSLPLLLPPLHRKTRTRHVAQAPAGGGLPCQETNVLEVCRC